MYIKYVYLIIYICKIVKYVKLYTTNDIYGVSIDMGTPIAGWFILENPIYRWMITGGTPILGNPHIPRK